MEEMNGSDIKKPIDLKQQLDKRLAELNDALKLKESKEKGQENSTGKRKMADAKASQMLEQRKVPSFDANSKTVPEGNGTINPRLNKPGTISFGACGEFCARHECKASDASVRIASST